MKQIKSIQKEIFTALFDNILKKLKCCIDVKGNTFEHYSWNFFLIWNYVLSGSSWSQWLQIKKFREILNIFGKSFVRHPVLKMNLVEKSWSNIVALYWWFAGMWLVIGWFGSQWMFSFRGIIFTSIWCTKDWCQIEVHHDLCRVSDQPCISSQVTYQNLLRFQAAGESSLQNLSCKA